eukprot:3696374-Pleurochrysis_carterae.AAC.2
MPITCATASRHASRSAARAVRLTPRTPRRSAVGVKPGDAAAPPCVHACAPLCVRMRCACALCLERVRALRVRACVRAPASLPTARARAVLRPSTLCTAGRARGRCARPAQ